MKRSEVHWSREMKHCQMKIILYTPLTYQNLSARVHNEKESDNDVLAKTDLLGQSLTDCAISSQFFCVCVCVFLFFCFFFNIFGGGYQTATRFNIPHFNNPFSCYYQAKNYLTNSFLLTLITLHSAFKHISLIHSDAYKL